MMVGWEILVSDWFFLKKYFSLRWNVFLFFLGMIGINLFGVWCVSEDGKYFFMVIGVLCLLVVR